MIKVWIEMCNEAARFDLAVQAQSIRQAVGIAKAQYPGGNANVRFPIDSEDFFVNNPAALEGVVELVKPEPERRAA